MTTPPIFKLAAGIQGYEWGKTGSSSLAAQMGERCVPGFEVDEGKTYAELWMGTHPTIPSHLLGTSTTLSKHLAANPSLIGEKVTTAFPDAKEGALPFLFKILSIGTALSIQAHPDKVLAKRLFAEQPDVYKDPNHKPEMAIALTPFIAFLNFLPLPTILLHLLSVPELDDLIPEAHTAELATSLTLPSTRPPDAFLFEPTVSPPSDAQKEILKRIFGELMSAPEDKVKKAIGDLISRYKEGTDIAESEKGLVELTIMLNEQYPGDVGVLCVFVLNVVETKPGEAAFLGANVPHAYIKGDIIECMATSDNVVRAGLTPKLRDVPTLVSMLTYVAGPGSKQLLKATPFGDSNASTLLYDPPIDEFSVLRVKMEDAGTTEHRAVEGPSVCVVTDGKGTVTWHGDGGEEEEEAFERGDVLFIGAGVKVEWKAEKKTEVFRAFVEAS